MTGKSVKYFSFLLLILFSLGELFPQDKEIEAKKNQLSDLKSEINNLEAELKSKTRKEKESFSAVENYSKQSFLLNKIISTYRTEEKLKVNQIVEREKKIKQLETNIKSLKENYAKYVVAVYKHGQPDEVEMLINSASVQQALLRMKYLEKFSDQREKDLNELIESREQLIAQKEILKAEKIAKEKLTAEKVNEQSSLLSRLVEQKKILKTIKNNNQELKKEIEAKKQAEIKIRSLISNLIAEAERKKKEEADRLAREKLKGDVRPVENYSGIKSESEEEGYEVNLSTEGFASFSARKGKLNWPVTGGKIVKRYGENKNNKTNTVMLNYGIDIAAGKDLNVKAVSEGIVSAIDWIPGYGSVIIITHNGDYRTVYSHLSEIYVNEGEKVNPGNVIAKVGDSLEGQVLHFEIWNSRQNQNPEIWLTRK
ncbi:MAG TPA: peptidoglycan DD-metalloendopeptidase family protein [Ignavibacteriaceae bacterium]|nr:peptidoglycan DD-metalloendopeptidase family protein [Ignavibacteriaceae bacterium]